MHIQVLPGEKEISQEASCRYETNLRTFIIFDNSVCGTVHRSGIVAITQRSGGVNLFYVVGEINAMAKKVGNA